ncbi:MAG TPA: hypothetical protein VFL97_02715, partial [Nitrococcus sp.]|nr:hypothetical protein [Nitrococcus sp.]
MGKKKRKSTTAACRRQASHAHRSAEQTEISCLCALAKEAVSAGNIRDEAPSTLRDTGNLSKAALVGQPPERLGEAIRHGGEAIVVHL